MFLQTNVYPGPYLKNNFSYQENKKDQFSNKRGPFSLFWVFLKEKTAFSLHFKRATPNNGCTR